MAGNLNGGAMGSASDILCSVKDVNGGLNRNHKARPLGPFNPYDVNVHNSKEQGRSSNLESRISGVLQLLYRLHVLVRRYTVHTQLVPHRTRATSRITFTSVRYEAATV